MSRKKRRQSIEDEDIKIYPDGPLTGAYRTQPISDPSRRFSATNVARPSDHEVADNREWIQENKL